LCGPETTENRAGSFIINSYHLKAVTPILSLADRKKKKVFTKARTTIHWNKQQATCQLYHSSTFRDSKFFDKIIACFEKIFKIYSHIFYVFTAESSLSAIS
jgi:hypothetical protein